MISFSIIMPTYNRAFCIQNAIDSLLKQTYQEFELIIIDDASSDNTEALIKEKYAQQLATNKITYIKLPKNKGVCNARNVGLKLANNEWIGYLDTDNTMVEDYLETFLNAIKENPNYKTFYAQMLVDSERIVGKPFDYKALLKANFIDMGVFVHHKSLIYKYGKFDTKLKRLVDWDLIIRYTKKKPPFFIEKILLKYSNNQTYERISNIESLEKARERIIYKHNTKFLERLFSIKNNKNTCHKVITICGLQIKLKSQKLKQEKAIKSLEQKINMQKREIEKIRTEYEPLKSLISLMKLKKINKEKVLSEMENNKNFYGITKEKRDTKLIISLTSYPERMYDIHFTLYSLLNQSIKPDEVILWLGAEQFPNKEEDVPHKVLNLVQYGLTIQFTHDIKSYKKLIPAIEKYPNDIVVTADDDIFYPSNWLEMLYNEHLQNKECIIAHRVHKINLDDNEQIYPYIKWTHCINDNSCSSLNFATGAGGILYPPHRLYKEVCNQELFTQLASSADDVWFWAMANLNHTKTKVINNPIKELTYVNPERELRMNEEQTLANINVLNSQNDIIIKNVTNHYPELLEKLKEEHA